MRHCYIWIACLLFSVAKGQPFQSGFRQITFTDQSRSNRSIPADVYYPADNAGTNVSVASGTQKFPVVVFGHGFLIAVGNYKWLGDSLARNGFIAAFPATELSGSPSHGAFGADLVFLVERITSLNDSSASFLFGRVKKIAAVGGHSMGGGSSFLAAASASSVLQALFNFAAAETNPSAQQAATQVNKATLIFSGSQDCIVPPSTQKSMYDAIPYSCKTYVNLTNALHCHFSNNDATCSLGQAFTGCNSSSITPAIVFQKVMSLLLPFLNRYLNQDCTTDALLQERFLSLTGAVKERSCTSDINGCSVSSIQTELTESDIRLFPNPVVSGNSFRLELPAAQRIQSFRIGTSDGRILQSGMLRQTSSVTFSLSYPPGYYLLILDRPGKNSVYKPFVVR